MFQALNEEISEKELHCAQANERCDRHLDNIAKLRQEIKDGLEDRKLSEKKGLTMVRSLYINSLLWILNDFFLYRGFAWCGTRICAQICQGSWFPFCTARYGEKQESLNVSFTSWEGIEILPECVGMCVHWYSCHSVVIWYCGMN